jgi:hypothetical protein
MSDAKKMSYDRMIAAALRYAAADRTDPFAFARAVAHINNGLATVARGERSNTFDLVAAQPAYYDADAQREVVKMVGAGGEIDVERITYKSVVRP